MTLNSWDEQSQFFIKKPKQTKRSFISKLQLQIQKYFGKKVHAKTVKRWIVKSLNDKEKAA